MFQFLKKIKRNYFNDFNEFDKYFYNIAWATYGKFYNLIVAGVSGIIVARHIGPENFGLLSYALGLYAIFSFPLNFSSEQPTIKILVNKKEKIKENMSSAFALKFSGAILVLILASVFLYATETKQEDSVKIFAVFLSVLFRPLEIISYYFQSKAEIKFITISENLTYTISFIFKMFLILTNKPIAWFFLAYAIETLLMGLLFINFLKKESKTHFNQLLDVSFINKKNILGIFKESWPLLFTGILISIYMRIDQIFIINMLGSIQNGIYSAAIKISELFIFIPTAIVSAVFPSVISTFTNNKKFDIRFLQLNYFLILFSVLFSIFLTIFGQKIINLFYGEKFSNSYEVLKVYAWSVIPISVGLVTSKWMIINHMQKYYLFSTFIGAFINIILNIILLPRIGISGAAWASIIAYSASGFFVYLFFKKTRNIIKIFFINKKQSEIYE